MHRLALLFAILAAAIAVPAAQANPPTRVPFPSSDFVDSTSCAFPVSIHVVTNGETAMIFSDGTVIVTGPLVWQFSANGKTITRNISGPVKITPLADGSVLVIGHGVGAGPLTNGPNGSMLALVAGMVNLNPDGTATLLHGTVLLDICAALA
jgi:hypothetical protein